MSIFDNLKGAMQSSGEQTGNSMNESTQKFIFQRLPESLDELKSMPEASLDTPFKTAALTVCALCAYGAKAEIGIEMLNFLRGPRPMSPMDLSFLKDRFMDRHYYIPFSYFSGTSPENDYEPQPPYELTISAGVYAYQNEGYAKLDLKSSGADSVRSVTLRKTGDGKWFLWEQFLMVGIRTPKSLDPWA